MSSARTNPVSASWLMVGGQVRWNENSQVASNASQVAAAICRIRRSIRSSTAGVKARAVPCSSQRSATTLVASPARIIVTEMTPASIGRLLRVMMVWKACTIWQATGSGSMPLCDMAACAPRPRIRILNSLLDANTGPVRSANCPAAMPGQLCAPNTACIG
ncbi:MAG TPA: hypothetical protein VHX52_07305 [Steroidobacteraceae bacterium]|nr:hypothetical protein [Steroidobacteraceae bacterium]